MEHQAGLVQAIWNPMEIFNCSSSDTYAVIILNSPILWKESVLRIWEQAQVTLTVDGGTHRWLTYLEENGINVFDGNHKGYIPNLITGDMDSCSPLLLKKLEALGSSIIETPDQNLTDYTKSLLQLGQYIQKKNINLNRIYVFAETSGRFDQIIGNINTLYKSGKYVGDIQVTQIASTSLSWLLQPGFHKIIIPEILVHTSSWCALLPFGTPVKHITTTGLKWNLNDASLEFGGLISSSNTYNNSTEVTVNTDTSVIWSMGIEPLGKSRDHHGC